MADYPLVIDVAKFQRSDLAFFLDMKSKGVKGVIIQITAGTAGYSYSVNPAAGEQIRNAVAAGLYIAAYHYCYSSTYEGMVAEADNFMTQFNAFGLDKKTNYAFLDEEDPVYCSQWATDDVNVWIDELKSNGFTKVGTYSMASWFTEGRINISKLHSPDLWVANVGVNAPGVDNADFWQFTWDFYGIDCNYDFFSKIVTDEPVQELPENPTPAPENIAPWNPIPYIVKDDDNLTHISKVTGDSMATIIANNPDVFPNGVNSIIYPDQTVLVNDHGGPLKEQKYIVKDGDTLWGMSDDPRKVGDRVDTIVANNPDVFHGDMNTTIYPGQTILYYR